MVAPVFPERRGNILKAVLGSSLFSQASLWTGTVLRWLAVNSASSGVTLGKSLSVLLWLHHKVPPHVAAEINVSYCSQFPRVGNAEPTTELFWPRVSHEVQPLNYLEYFLPASLTGLFVGTSVPCLWPLLWSAWQESTHRTG